MKTSKTFTAIVRRMEKYGYYYDEIESYRGHYRFNVDPIFAAAFPSIYTTQREIVDTLRTLRADGQPTIAELHAGL